MNLVAMSATDPNGGEVQLQYLTKQPDADHHSAAVSLGDLNMASPASLAKFVTLMKTEPKNRVGDTPEQTAELQHMPDMRAQHYGVILNDHGGAHTGEMQDQVHNHFMSEEEIEKGFKDGRVATDGKPLEWIGHDACLEACAETLTQLMHECKFMAGSQETEAGPGWTMNETVSDVKRSGEPQGSFKSGQAPTTRGGGEFGINQIMTPEFFQGAAQAAMDSAGTRGPDDGKEFVKKIVTMARGHQGDLATFTGFDMAGVPALLEAAKGLKDALNTTTVPKNQIAMAAKQSQKFYMENDMVDYCNHLGNLGDAKLADAAKKLAAAASSNNLVVAEEHSDRYPNAHGLSLETTPQRTGDTRILNPDLRDTKAGSSYKDHEWEKQTGLNAAITKASGGSTGGYGMGDDSAAVQA
jgi:hypothetical protein